MTAPWLNLIDDAWPRFVSKLSASDPLACWPWTGARSRGKGNKAWYGSFHVGMVDGVKITVRAHIFAAAAIGEYQEGMSRDHFVCGNTICVNPFHSETVTGRENSRRRWICTPTWRKVA
jgi:hypothetical protein